uniref:Flp family type IVb pilin n=1 Tax=Yoonia sp. TaxID=2212373 RepID=UPI0040487833
MLNFIKNFRNDEDGAVTVDWVVLTAAIVLLGVAVGNSVGTGAKDLADAVGGDLTALSLE